MHKSIGSGHGFLAVCCGAGVAVGAVVVAVGCCWGRLPGLLDWPGFRCCGGSRGWGPGVVAGEAGDSKPARQLFSDRLPLQPPMSRASVSALLSIGARGRQSKLERP